MSRRSTSLHRRPATPSVTPFPTIASVTSPFSDAASASVAASPPGFAEAPVEAADQSGRETATPAQSERAASAPSADAPPASAPPPPDTGSWGHSISRISIFPLPSSDPPVHRSGESGEQEAKPDATPAVDHALRNGSGGQPLDSSARSFLEPRFGHDFSQIRVHTDARAEESAESVSARAYTVGSDIVFGRGQYQPGTSAGRELLAHELTHTLQQTGSAPMTRRRADGAEAGERPALQEQPFADGHHFARISVLPPPAQPTLSRSGDPSEQEAEQEIWVKDTEPATEPGAEGKAKISLMRRELYDPSATEGGDDVALPVGDVLPDNAATSFAIQCQQEHTTPSSQDATASKLKFHFDGEPWKHPLGTFKLSFDVTHVDAGKGQNILPKDLVPELNTGPVTKVKEDELTKQNRRSLAWQNDFKVAVGGTWNENVFSTLQFPKAGPFEVYGAPEVKIGEITSTAKDGKWQFDASIIKVILNIRGVDDVYRINGKVDCDIKASKVLGVEEYKLVENLVAEGDKLFEITKRHTELTEEMATHAKKIEDINKQINDLHRKINGLRLKNTTDARRQIVELQNQMSQLQNSPELKELKNTISSLKEKIKEVKTLLDKTRASINKMVQQGKSALFKSAAGRYLSTIGGKLAKLFGHRIAKALLHIIPLLGIIMIAADVYEAVTVSLGIANGWLKPYWEVENPSDKTYQIWDVWEKAPETKPGEADTGQPGEAVPGSSGEAGAGQPGGIKPGETAPGKLGGTGMEQPPGYKPGKSGSGQPGAPVITKYEMLSTLPDHQQVLFAHMKITGSNKGVLVTDEVIETFVAMMRQYNPTVKEVADMMINVTTLPAITAKQALDMWRKEIERLRVSANEKKDEVNKNKDKSTGQSATSSVAEKKTKNNNVATIDEGIKHKIMKALHTHSYVKPGYILISWVGPWQINTPKHIFAVRRTTNGVLMGGYITAIPIRNKGGEWQVRLSAGWFVDEHGQVYAGSSFLAWVSNK